MKCPDCGVGIYQECHPSCPGRKKAEVEAIGEEGAPNQETIIIPGAEDLTLVALKEGYQAAFFPDANHKTNPYLGTGKVDLAWAWLEGFHYGTHCVALQNEVARLKLEVANLKTYLGDALPVAPMQPA